MPVFSAAPSGIDTSLPHMQALFETPLGDPSDVPGQRTRVLAQLHRTYILASDGEGLLLLDQHAAHERIAYESIVERAREHAPSEPLLVPIVVELDAGASIALDRRPDTARVPSISPDFSTISPRNPSSAACANGSGRRSRVIP